jgi:GNAT superfamily N-acetyltransferase
VDRTVFVPTRSNLEDSADWQALAREVESLFGQRMAGEATWERQLAAHFQRGTAWCVRDVTRTFSGGMWLSLSRDGYVHIRWLAVARAMRGRGVGRALVSRAIEQAAGRPVHVITFGAGHPGGAEAEVARRLYRRLGFRSHEHEPAADGTPRELLVHPPAGA